MSVDQYSLCPCGNGKKIKFCKCSDSVSEMDQVLTMIEGGQVVAALDRLRTILDEHPDAAWALAIRGRLLLDLREYDSLAENADRFIRLQPANPLALTQHALAQVFASDMKGATESLLQALDESGPQVDAFLMDAALIVATGLAQAGVILSARVFALLTLNAEGFETEAASQFLAQLDSSPGVNHLLKSVPQLISRPSDASWGERYDEAAGLLRSNKVLLAQDKFESLRRTASGEASVYSGLFHCAVWRGDLEAQTEMAERLSEVESLDEFERMRYRAVAGLLSPIGRLSVNSQTVRLEFDDVDQAEMSLIASDRTEQLAPQQVSQIQVPEGEIRPRSAFFISDRVIDSEEDAEPNASEVPATIALAMLFGKQTDKGAEVVAYDVTEDRVETVTEILKSAVPTGEVVLEEPIAIPMAYAMDDRPIRKSRPSSIAEMARFNRDFAAAHDGKRACQLTIPLLGGKSLEAAADDDGLQFERGVVVRVLEGQERLVSIEGVLDDVYSIAKVERPPEIVPTEETVSKLTTADFFRVNPEKLSAMNVFVLAANARQSGANFACRKFSQVLIDKTLEDQPSDTDGRMTLEAYMLNMMSTPEPVEAVAIADQAIEFAKSKSLSFAPVLLARLELCLSMADQEGFQKSIMEIEKNYGNDPAVMARVQQLLMQLGIIRPDGSPRDMPAAPGAPGNDFTPAPPPGESAGVWTPDQPSDPSPASGEGGGKLWIPGMD